jgi:carbon storage regulator
MLVLTRKINEGIQVGQDIRIVILATGHRSVRVGIHAPEDIAILRDEIWHARKSFSKKNFGPQQIAYFFNR